MEDSRSNFTLIQKLSVGFCASGSGADQRPTPMLCRPRHEEFQKRDETQGARVASEAGVTETRGEEVDGDVSGFGTGC